MSLFEELIEDRQEDEKIVKSFEPKDSLSDQIFEGSEGKFSMRDDIRKTLLKITDDFIETLGVEFFIHDIVLTGSLSNYNWSQFSDVDLHILIDFEESKYPITLLKEFFDAKKNVWNEKNDIKIKGFDVELYVQDVNEEHISSGVYSVLNNEWVVEPSMKKENIDSRKILEKGEFFAKRIDQLIDYHKNGKDVDKMALDLRDKLKKFRKSGLESGGEYSYENLTFKLLRRNGYIEKLMDLRNAISNKKLSLS